MDPSRPDFCFKSAVDAIKADHSATDVPVYTTGPFSHFLSGVYEQSFINHVMQYAACLNDVSFGARHCS